MTISHRIVRLILFLFVPFISFPKQKANYKDVGITTLLCHRDVPYFFYTIGSFFSAIQRRLPIYIVDDGSLTVIDKFILKYKLGVSVESCSSVEKRARELFSKYKHLFSFRFAEDSPILKKKLDAFFLHPFQKAIYLDADVFFLNLAREISDWLEGNSVDFYYTTGAKSYLNSTQSSDRHIRSLRKLINYHQGIEADLLFSSGLLCFGRSSKFMLKVCDVIMKRLEEVEYDRDWLTEETLMSLLFAKMKASALPCDSYLNLWRKSHISYKNDDNVVMMHYAYETKAFFGPKALKSCLNNGFYRYSAGFFKS